MSKKIFFIVLSCCLLVVTFCVSFAGAPQVQSAPADIRAVLDCPDCASAPLIVPPVVEPLYQWEIPPFDDSITADIAGTYVLDFTLPVSDFGHIGNIVVPNLGSYDVGINQYFYFYFMGDFSLYTYDTNELVYSFVFDSSQYQDARLSFGVNDVGSYFFTLKCLTVDYVNTTIFELSNFDKYLLVFDFTLSDTTSLYAFYDNLTSRIVNVPFLKSGGDSSLVAGGQMPLINAIYSGNVFYTYVPRISPTVFVDQIVEILISGLTVTGEAIGEAFSVLAESIFINADGTALSTFGVLIVVFASVSLGLSLTRFVLNFCTSWGKRNR